MLVEVAWHYRLDPRVSPIIATRQEGVPSAVAEALLRRNRLPTRPAWLGALFATTIIAGLSLWSQVREALPNEPPAISKSSAWQPMPHLPVPPVVQRAQQELSRNLQAETARLQGLALEPSQLIRAGLALSICMLAVLAINAWTLNRRVQQWRCSELMGTTVYIAPDAGPAVVGLWRPQIVLPEWLLRASPAEQQLVLAHERAHLVGRDPQWLAVALLMLALMPWNFAMWWQIKRLRRSMEVDCDARVLSEGYAPRTYGKVLLEVGQRQSMRLRFASSMSVSTPFLEQRIKLMMQAKSTSAMGRALAVSLALLALGFAATAAQLGSPGSAVTLPPDVLSSLEGDYQTGEQEVLHISHEGSRLFAQSTGRPRVEWKAYGDTELAALNGRQRATVQRDARGQVAGLTLHLHGTDLAARRMTDAEVQRIADGIASRVRAQIASPGTEAAVRRFVAQIQMTPARVDGLSPLMVAGVQEQNERMRPVFAKLGAIKSVEFAGVSPTGYDKYLMQFEHGSILWDILLDADGTIARVNFTFPSI